MAIKIGFSRRFRLKTLNYYHSIFYRLLLFLNHFGVINSKCHKAYLFLEPHHKFEKIPGATTPNERKYLYFFTKYFYQGKGCICELGCAFGSLSMSLAEGLSCCQKQIQSFDNFQWHHSWGEALKDTKFHRTLSDGDDFQHIFKHYTKKNKSKIDIRSENLESYTWNDKSDIELLVVDVMKNIKITNNVLNNFYPYLRENSYLFHQDFCHFFEPWIHILQYRLREFFRPVLHIEDSPSFIFQLTKTLPHDLGKININSETILIEEIENAFAYSLSLVEEEPARQNIYAAKIYCMFACSFFKEGKVCLNDTLNSYDFVEKGNLEYVTKISSSIDKDLEEIKSRLEKGVNLLLDLDYITKANQG